LPNTQQFMGRYSAAIEETCYRGILRWRASWWTAFCVAILAVVSFTLMSSHSPFLYFRF
jgi:hypothetical protein